MAQPASLPGPVALLLFLGLFRCIESKGPFNLEVPPQIMDPSIEKCPMNCRCDVAPIVGRDCGVTAECADWLVFPEANEYPEGIDCLIVVSPMLGALNETVKERGYQNIPSTVKRLELNQCQLSELPNRAFEHLRELRILKLEYNRFTTIPADAFYGLRFLKVLSLAGNGLEPGAPSYDVMETYKNKIEELHDSQFHTLENLQVLNLMHNQIQEITPRIFVDQKKLRVLKLAGNPGKNKLKQTHIAFKDLLASNALVQLDLEEDAGDELENYFYDTNTSLSDDYGGPGPLPRPAWAEKLAAERDAKKKRKQAEKESKEKKNKKQDL